MLVKQVVDELKALLECTQKNIASFIGVSEVTLSNAMNTLIHETTERKLGKNLNKLIYVVTSLKLDPTLDSASIKKVLISPYYELEDGNYVDVIAAIHLGDFRNEQLVEVAKAALDKLRNKFYTEKKPAKDSLYRRAFTDSSKSGS
jgi:hypothetical protein